MTGVIPGRIAKDAKEGGYDLGNPLFANVPS